MNKNRVVLIKRWLRGLGWKNPALQDLNVCCRYFKKIHDPKTQIQESNLPDHEFGRRVRDEILYYEDYRTTEYIFEFEEAVTVEPMHGMIVARSNQLLCSLLAVHRSVYVPPPHFFQYHSSRRRLHRVPGALLLRHHYGEANYFHFYADVLSMFGVVKKFPEYEEIPFLVSRRQFEASYFQGFIKRAGLSEREWIVQDGEAIEVQRLSLIHISEPTRPY